MKGNFTTDYGKVVIDNEVIAKVAGTIAVECFGIVGMASTGKSDGIVKMLTGKSQTKGIKVNVDQEGVTIDFHVIVSYGVSIASVSDNLIQNVKYQIENLTNFKVKKINIFIEGVRVID